MPENNEARVATVDFTIDDADWTNEFRPVIGTNEWVNGFIVPGTTVTTGTIRLDDTISERLEKLEAQFEDFSVRLFNIEQQIKSVDDAELMNIVGEKNPHPFMDVVRKYLEGAM